MKSLKKYQSFIFLVAFSILYGQLIAQEVQKELEAHVDEICASWKADGPGGVVAIVEKGEIIFSKAYGLASLEYEVPNSANTIFNIASVSKQFTAYSMVLLEQEGRLSIDDDVRKYLPEIPDFGDTITIRHLLNHTSGLRNFQNMLGMAGWREGEAMTNEDLLRFTAQQKELNFPVGSEYLYCNSGFVLITFIVERITGMSFQDWTRENIFLPLGMNDSGYREDMEAIYKNTATSYDSQDNMTFTQPLKYWTYMGNGNVYTTVGDLAKWIDNFRSPVIGGAGGIKRLLEPGILNNGDTLSYALGIGVSTYRGLKRYAHGGSVGGYRSNLTYFPQTETGFIVISNFSSADAGGKASQLTDYYLEDKFKKPKAESTSRYSHLTTEVEIDPLDFEQLAGSYLVEGVHVKVYSEKGKMFVHPQGIAPVLPLSAASDTSFFVPEAGITFYILKGRNIQPDRIIVLQEDDRMSGYKLNPNLSSVDQLKQYAGTYYSPELKTEYVLTIEEGKLMAHHQRHGSIEVHPIQEDYLKAEAFYLRDIEMVRWASLEIKGMKVSNGRVRNLWFQKQN